MFLRLLYSVLLTAASPILLFTLYRTRPNKPKFGPRWKEHFGFTPKTNQSSPIWLHAVSVGEVIAATPIIQSLKKARPEQAIIVTTTTSTGAEQVSKLGDLVEHRYMPIDFQWCIRGFLRAVRPQSLLIMETELWPNTLHCVAKQSIPITVINARLSERSCQRYARVKPVFKMLTSSLSQVLCQYPDDAERFVRLGMEQSQVKVTGSIKFDIHVDKQKQIEGQQLRQSIGEQRPVWVAASTHKGEDETLLEAHKKIAQQFPDALLIIVPRHPERFEEVYELIIKRGFSCEKRTAQGQLDDIQVYLGDTMGEMMTLLEAADICFMGGSLLGDKVGGHNLLEPAALSKALMIGPSYFNFSTITDMLLANKAVQIVGSESEIAKQVLYWFHNPVSANQAGERAQQVVEQNRGALSKTLNEIAR